MEQPVPMDRLICGDVGYGKTEIAVRAAFKAVQDGKQVAVLVPTTLLVQQHFVDLRRAVRARSRSTCARCRGSRPTARRKAVLAGPGRRQRSTSSSAPTGCSATRSRFKDLGLVVVDEEQRFGVEHKEHLKPLRTDVDVLAMSATPIPRTLEMAVTGIREMSTIQTPPEERHPVLTFVGAVRREADRAPRSAASCCARARSSTSTTGSSRSTGRRRGCASWCPRRGSRSRTARWTSARSSRSSSTSGRSEFDVLVCTTIVESGIDISNANTLIVERADAFGLSQLHQLRGRVGRGRERAYAYFLYPPEKPLTETAHDRLATIAQHTDLGAGMYVAMKDLEIRGAGNLLGGEQSGHIAGVGFDLYVRLVGEAVAELQGRDAAEPRRASRSRSSCRSTRTCRTTTSRRAAAAGGLPADRRRQHRRRRAGRARGARRPLRPAARPGRDAARGGLAAGARPRRRAHARSPSAGQQRPLRAGRAAGVAASCGCSGSTRARIVKPAIRTILVPRPTTARIGGEPLRDIELLAWCREVVRSVLLDGAPQKAGRS